MHISRTELIDRLGSCRLILIQKYTTHGTVTRASGGELPNRAVGRVKGREKWCQLTAALRRFLKIRRWEGHFYMSQGSKAASSIYFVIHMKNFWQLTGAGFIRWCLIFNLLWPWFNFSHLAVVIWLNPDIRLFLAIDALFYFTIESSQYIYIYIVINGLFRYEYDLKVHLILTNV